MAKRRSFFDYLRRTHEEGGFWLNCVRLKRQVRAVSCVSYVLYPTLTSVLLLYSFVLHFCYLHEFSRFGHVTYVPCCDYGWIMIRRGRSLVCDNQNSINIEVRRKT